MLFCCSFCSSGLPFLHAGAELLLASRLMFAVCVGSYQPSRTRYGAVEVVEVRQITILRFGSLRVPTMYMRCRFNTSSSGMIPTGKSDCDSQDMQLEAHGSRGNDTNTVGNFALLAHAGDSPRQRKLPD